MALDLRVDCIRLQLGFLLAGGILFLGLNRHRKVFVSGKPLLLCFDVGHDDAAIDGSSKDCVGDLVSRNSHDWLCFLVLGQLLLNKLNFFIDRDVLPVHFDVFRPNVKGAKGGLENLYQSA